MGMLLAGTAVVGALMKMHAVTWHVLPVQLVESMAVTRQNNGSPEGQEIDKAMVHPPFSDISMHTVTLLSILVCVHLSWTEENNEGILEEIRTFYLRSWYSIRFQNRKSANNCTLSSDFVNLVQATRSQHVRRTFCCNRYTAPTRCHDRSSWERKTFGCADCQGTRSSTATDILNHAIRTARETRKYLHRVQIGKPRGSVYIRGKQRQATGKEKQADHEQEGRWLE